MDQKDRAVSDIEDAFEGHWRRFGLYPGAQLFDEDGVLWFESPIAHLPYNAVIRSRIAEDRADAVAERVDRRFRGRVVPYMWVVRPSDSPENLGLRLSRLGLDMVEVATGMDLELADCGPLQGPEQTRVVEVGDDQGMSDCEELIRTYWSVPDSGREHLRTLNRFWWGERNPGVRFVAYDGARPLGKLFLNLSELPSRASVYGMSVLPEARGRGVATKMMELGARQGKVGGRGKDGAPCQQHGQGPVPADGLCRTVLAPRLCHRPGLRHTSSLDRNGALAIRVSTGRDDYRQRFVPPLFSGSASDQPPKPFWSHYRPNSPLRDRRGPLGAPIPRHR